MTVGLRVSAEDERLGADAVMHGLIDTDDSAHVQECRACRKSSANRQKKTICDDAEGSGHGCDVTRPRSMEETETVPVVGRSFTHRTFSHMMRRSRREHSFKSRTFTKSVQFVHPVFACSESRKQYIRHRGRNMTLPSRLNPRSDVMEQIESEECGGVSREVLLTPSLVSPAIGIGQRSSFEVNGRHAQQAISVYI